LIEDLKSKLNLTREGSGIYLANENYRAFKKQEEERELELSEKIAEIRICVNEIKKYEVRAETNCLLDVVIRGRGLFVNEIAHLKGITTNDSNRFLRFGESVLHRAAAGKQRVLNLVFCKPDAVYFSTGVTAAGIQPGLIRPNLILNQPIST